MLSCKKYSLELLQSLGKVKVPGTTPYLYGGSGKLHCQQTHLFIQIHAQVWEQVPWTIVHIKPDHSSWWQHQRLLQSSEFSSEFWTSITRSGPSTNHITWGGTDSKAIHSHHIPWLLLIHPNPCSNPEP